MSLATGFRSSLLQGLVVAMVEMQDKIVLGDTFAAVDKFVVGDTLAAVAQAVAFGVARGGASRQVMAAAISALVRSWGDGSCHPHGTFRGEADVASAPLVDQLEVLLASA